MVPRSTCLQARAGHQDTALPTTALLLGAWVRPTLLLVFICKTGTRVPALSCPVVMWGESPRLSELLAGDLYQVSEGDDVTRCFPAHKRQRFLCPRMFWKSSKWQLWGQGRVSFLVHDSCVPGTVRSVQFSSHRLPAMGLFHRGHTEGD